MLSGTSHNIQQEQGLGVPFYSNICVLLNQRQKYKIYVYETEPKAQR